MMSEGYWRSFGFAQDESGERRVSSESLTNLDHDTFYNATADDVFPHRAHFHIFQGAWPEFQSSSNVILSRRVSIGRQKPRWR